MNYLAFSAGFTLIHMVAYVAAGAVAFAISKDIYTEKARLMDYLRDMADPKDKAYVGKTFLVAQIPRGILMSAVLYPLLGVLGEVTLAGRIVFLGGLMLIYTEISSAIPFPTNLEGWVYMKPRYFQGRTIMKFWLEITLYSVLFALPAAWLLF